MSRRFVPRGKSIGAGPKKTVKADHAVHMCTQVLSHLDGERVVMFRLARRCVSQPTVPTEFFTKPLFFMTASDIAWSARNAQSPDALQLKQWGIGFEKLTGRPLPSDKGELEQLAFGGGTRRRY